MLSADWSSLYKFIEEGGVIMYVLLILNIISFSIILYKLFYIVYFQATISKQSDNIKKKISKKMNVTDKISILKEKVSNRIFKLEYGMGFVKTTATISPLLGLLGTVIGIFESFQIVASKGLSDPTLFAGGISLALITTIGGLVVSIPNYFFYNFIISKYDSFEVKLEEDLLKDVSVE